MDEEKLDKDKREIRDVIQFVFNLFLIQNLIKKIKFYSNNNNYMIPAEIKKFMNEYDEDKLY